jgi:hypothetical protein
MPPQPGIAMPQVIQPKNRAGRPTEEVETEMETELIQHLDRLHTTARGAARIRKNLATDTDDVVEWCKTAIASPDAVIRRGGKNWYVCVRGCTLTVNASSYTIITAHRTK